MRISFRHQYDTYLSDLNRTQSAYLGAQQRLTTGKRLNQPSDDAAGTLLTVKARALRAAFDQYSRNLDSADISLKTGEAALDDVQVAVRRARELAIQGATATLDQSARNAIADEIAAIQKKLVDHGNTQVANGDYIFAGQRTDTKPFEVVNGAIVYHGDDAEVVVEMSAGDTLVASGSGRVVIGDTWEALEALRQNLLAGNTANISSQDLPALD
jgi:flagellar hook-associated protein 3 FlgL